MKYIGQTARLECYIADTPEPFVPSYCFEISDEKAKSLYKPTWEQTREAFKDAFLEILLIYIP